MNTIALPDSLVTQLRTFEGRLRRMETLAAVAGALAGLLVTFVLLFVFDRFVDTPRPVRIALTFTGAALAAWWAHAWASHWVWNRRGPAQLAKILQRHFKTLGDRLQGVIELAGATDLPANISPALMRAAIRQVAEESHRFDFGAAVPVRPVRRWGFAAALLAVLAAAPFVLVPKAATNALQRWLAPWSDIERYTFASIDALPAELVVAHGEPFEIACGLKPDSAWKPETATARLNALDPQEARLQEGRAVFRLTGQTRDGRLAIRVGDATREIGIRPMHRPEMKELAARIDFPGYLGYPAATVPVPGSTVDVLEGGKVSFIGRTSRALKAAAMQTGEAEPEAAVSEATFTTPARPIAEIAGDASFRWTDAHGLTPTQPYKLRVAASKDSEPRIDLQGLDPETAILPGEVLKLNFASTDDYGVKQAWLGWTVRTLGEKKQPVGDGSSAHIQGEPTKRELGRTAEFSPQWHKIPEDSVIELAAYAVDYFPERKPVESWKHTIYVLSPAKHAERVRERMDQVLKQLDERIRDEERQLEETKTIAQDKAQLPNERTAEDLKRAEAGEKANAAQLEKLTAEMKDVMKDALRNKDIPEGTVADWQQLTEKLEKEANPPMGEAAQSLQKAAQQPQEREKQVAQAQQKQQEALDAMRTAANKMSTANQNLYARNFYNRLRAAAAAENKISDGLKSLAKETIGQKPDEIPEARKKEFTLVAEGQDNATKDVDGIVKDLGAFIKRMPNEQYGAVHKEMNEKKVVAELTDLAGFVRANLGLKSVGRARQWSEQLNEWATMLQSECKSQGSGGEMDPDVMEFIVGMVRAAVAQDTVREQTQIVDGQKTENPKQHEREAVKLSGQQDDVSRMIGGLLSKIWWNEFKPAQGLKLPPALGGEGGGSKFAKFEPLLREVQKLTGEIAVDLKNGETDQEIVAAQGMVIEMLVPPDKKGGKGESKMQQMMQKMMAAATKARSGGGNNSKSGAGAGGDGPEGIASRAGVTARDVEKAGGASNAGEWPEEFRDQLQAFFQQIESAGK